MGNLKVIWGSDHKVGTTMLAQSCAEKSAELNEDTLLMSLGDNPGDDFYDGPAGNIDELRSRLSCSLLTKENIREYAVKGKVISKLNGLSDPKEMFGFTRAMGEELIKMAADAFENVIIDCGTGLHSPLTLAALSYSRNNIFVFSQQESSIRNWERLSEKMSSLGAVPRLAVINKFSKGDKFSQGYIAQRTGLPQNIIKTVSESEFGVRAEADRQTILFYGDKQYEKDIKNLVS